MTSSADQCQTDMVTNRLSSFLWWGLPSLVIVGAIFLPDRVAEILWVTCFAIMAIGCARNAKHCGRVHCHYTAPWFAFISLVIALMALKWIPAWCAPSTLAISGLVGLVVIWLVTEKLWGRYRH